MSKVVRFHRMGGPEVLQIDNVDVRAPAAGEVRIKVKALGLNRAEAMYRSGQYTLPQRCQQSSGMKQQALLNRSVRMSLNMP